jgi:cytochrome b561
MALAARLGHISLYALLLATLVLGATDAIVRRDSLFGLAHLPSIDLTPAARHAADKQVVSAHRTCANLLLWLAGAHALIALAHHVLLRDGVLARMVPGLRPRPPCPNGNT